MTLQSFLCASQISGKTSKMYFTWNIIYFLKVRLKKRFCPPFYLDTYELKYSLNKISYFHNRFTNGTSEIVVHISFTEQVCSFTITMIWKGQSQVKKIIIFAISNPPSTIRDCVYSLTQTTVFLYYAINFFYKYI